MIPFKMTEVPLHDWQHLNFGEQSDILRVFKSDRFLVQVREQGSSIRLSINKVKWSKHGNKAIWQDGITWDELQEIKNQCGYSDRWLCEYFPPKDKLVNVANIRHLWLMDKAPEQSL